MKHNKTNLKILSMFAILLNVTAPAFTSNLIKIHVHSEYKNTFALGYKVNGKSKGAVGSNYNGKGPANSIYKFGLRKKSSKHTNITCGTHKLTHDSKVILIINGNTCEHKLSALNKWYKVHCINISFGQKFSTLITQY